MEVIAKKNVKNSMEMVKALSNSKLLKDLENGSRLNVTAIVEYTDCVSDGEVKTIAVLGTAEGEYYSTVSPTAISTINMAMEMIENIDEMLQNGTLWMEKNEKKSNAGRKFITLDLV